MTKKKSKPKPSSYHVWIQPAVHSERKRLPGNVRQRIKRFLTDLAQKPRPASSESLDLPDTVANSIKVAWEVRRFRLGDWRVIYAVNETWQEIAVLGIRKRPPYDYEDLASLLSHLW